MDDNHLPANDPFREKREAEGILKATFQGKKIPMILGFRDVRAAAADWKTFSNDAPFRVPIPVSYTHLRMRRAGAVTKRRNWKNFAARKRASWFWTRPTLI